MNRSADIVVAVVVVAAVVVEVQVRLRVRIEPSGVRMTGGIHNVERILRVC